MRAISIKALVIANICFFVIAALVACVIVFGAVLGAAVLDGENSHEIAAGLAASALFFCFAFASAMIVAAIGAG